MAVLKPPLKLGVLISGRGSNLQALIDAVRAEAFPAEIALVISNKKDAAGLQRAAEAGIPTKVIDHKAFAGREAFELALDDALRQAGVGLVCLAGFMRVLGAAFVGKWQDKMINIHPSLLPAYPGLDTHRRAIEAGEKYSGCTVHFVWPEVDAGPVILQGKVPVRPGDNEDALAARVLELEHKLYPLAVRIIAEGKARIVDGRVVLDDATGKAVQALLALPGQKV
ncbi:MAG: phosphoribosylglycinamide formyltransferase [Alphaproteobacteria bacterium]|nr:phosphoribosylglycinamide formyltransferase [Alphaproteobacteria bacterium]